MRLSGESTTPLPRPSGLAMRQCCIGPGDDAVASLVSTPAKIHPITVQWQFRGKPTQLVPDIASDEHPCRRPTQYRL